MILASGFVFDLYSGRTRSLRWILNLYLGNVVDLLLLFLNLCRLSTKVGVTKGAYFQQFATLVSMRTRFNRNNQLLGRRPIHHNLHFQKKGPTYVISSIPCIVDKSSSLSINALSIVQILLHPALRMVIRS